MTVCHSVALVISFLSATLALASCSRQSEPAPRFPIHQCRSITLIDSLTGREVVGAEDLDLDRAGGRLFISAYDRKAAERSVGRQSKEIPHGGLYVVNLSEVAGDETEIRARSIIEPKSVIGGLRPHGIFFDDQTGGLTFINRGYFLEKKGWSRRTEILTLAASGELSVANAADCSANDLASHDGRLLVTLDHDGCGFNAVIEDVLGLKQSKLIDADGEAIENGFGFANGVAVAPGGTVLVAATREKALYPIILSEGGSTRLSAIRLGAAPDNLSLSDDGKIVAAAHPSLLAIGLQRRLGIGRSPSRIIEVDPDTGAVELLFDDRGSSLISAATAAIATKGLLVIGSVVDSGLVVCRSTD